MTEEIAPGFRSLAGARDRAAARVGRPRHAARPRGSSSSGPIRGWSRWRPTDARWPSRPTCSGRPRRSGRSRPPTPRATRSSARRWRGSARFCGGLLEMTPPSLDAPAAARAVGSAEDRAPLPRARPDGRLPAAALDADGGRRSRRRVVRDRSAEGGDRRARDLRHGAGTVVGRHRRGAAAECGERSGAGRQQRHGQGRRRRADRGDGGRRAEAGAEIRTGASVARMLVRDGRAAGVVLDDGTEIPATR